MIESIVETDDALLERYFEGDEISLDELNKAIRKATIAKMVTPMLCGSSYKNKGVQNLLDAMVEYLPSPLDIPPIKGINPNTEQEEERPADFNAPLAGLAFKIATDPFVGGLTFFRVYSGVLKAGSYVYNSITGKQNVLDVLSECTQTTELKSVKLVQVTLLRLLDSKTQSQDTHFVTKTPNST